MQGLPLADRHETVLPAPPPEAAGALLDAAARPEAERAALVAAAVAAHPASVDAWSALAAVTTDPVARYAYARVGYHRGLDALRANGWGGVGLVRWARPTNRAFLVCLVHLRDAAAAIGEDPEVARIDAFLADLDPDLDVEAVRA